MKKYRELDDFEKISNMYAEVKVQCKCGHKNVFPYWIDRKVCTWCGYYVYRTPQIEFREKLLKALKKYENTRI